MVQRIMIIGCCGSGKSTLSKKIQERTKLPLIHLDKEYFGPDWEKPAKDEWKRKVINLCKNDKWIIDGNYISSMHIRITRADLVVFIDISRFKCLLRAVLRASRKTEKHRSDMADGCNERHDFEFYKFIWNFNKTTKPLIIQLVKQFENVELVVIKNNKDIESLLNRF
ncbi:MAG: topology modulation protein [Clostridiaceae bacterium]